MIVTELILKCKLEDKTFGEILIKCYLNEENVEADEPQVGHWGEFSLEGDFALDLSYLEPPEYAVPVAFPDLICIFLPFLPSCRAR